MPTPKTLQLAIADMKVVKGELPNVMDAAMRDITFSIKDQLEADWPVDTGRSLAGFATKHERSGDEISWSIVNDVDYAPFVHDDPRHGGPPGLATRLIRDIIAKQNYTHMISKRVMRLFK